MKSDNTSEKAFDSATGGIPVKDNEMASVSGGVDMAHDIAYYSLNQGDLMNNLWSQLNAYPTYGAKLKQMVDDNTKACSLQKYSASKMRWVAAVDISVNLGEYSNGQIEVHVNCIFVGFLN
ncbi:MAG: hypothetical protein LUD16_02670 [Lachnospiraceae bacterium]|nr:hypothetical protein [Lachnospiraceae bacterium]